MNLLGRKEYFASFISRQLKLERPSKLSKQVTCELDDFSRLFDSYSSFDVSRRKRVVVDCRKFISKLSIQYKDKFQISSPKLVFKSSKLSSSQDKQFLSLSSNISHIPGVGPKIIKLINRLNINCVNDALLYYPRDYIDYSNTKRLSNLISGEYTTIIATIRRCSIYKSPRNPNLVIFDLFLADITGRIKVTKFFVGKRFSNYSFIRNQTKLFLAGLKVAVSGLVKEDKFGLSFKDPIIELLDNDNSKIKSDIIGQIVPIYSLTEGLNSRKFLSIIQYIINHLKYVIDPIPESIINDNSLVSLNTAIRNIHFPKNSNSLSKAKQRLVFNEFFFLQLGLLVQRITEKQFTPPSFNNDFMESGLVGKFLELLPYELTCAQKKVLNEVSNDLKSDEPMGRLIQGDVGSGKTVVAIASLLKAVEFGWQGVLMAPTEVLAKQHYSNLCRWFPHLNVSVDLLTGSTTQRSRRVIFDNLSSGGLKIIVGTHALLEEKVIFSRLGLVVVDEQHRFGVNQRNLLLKKGLHPHLLTMTATPIPRTLALSVHGDLDVSLIDELPPGRIPVITSVLDASNRSRAYDLIRREIQKGFQAYYVLPLVDESEKLDLRSAVEVYHELTNNIFPELNIGLLHGRMAPFEKEAVIQKFAKQEISVLVSTTVIEVGIDVPTATVMVIDNSDRFGLAQLHQLRGRVGRGSASSECILINSGSHPLSSERLSILESSQDGFEISEADLRLRGPGQALGTKQSGLPDFVLANLVDDKEILIAARKSAEVLISKDPHLDNCKMLKTELSRHWNQLVSRSQLN